MQTSYDGATISYDAVGNPLFYKNWRFTWEHGRQLASLSTGSAVWRYTYDASGMRTSRTSGATTYTYVYNGDLLMKMTVGNVVMEFAYDASGTPMTVTLNGVTYYYLTNIQGDVVSIVDGNGTLVVHYSYDAWGNIIATSGTMANTLGSINPLRYRGYVYDEEIGLYYLQSRYYSPKTGRFLNADEYVSTSQGILGNNMFAYCLNNPVNLVDYLGRRGEWAFEFRDSLLDPEVGEYYNKLGRSSLDSATRNLPLNGDPNSSQTLLKPDGTIKQKRWYDKEGKPERDRDYDHGGDNLEFPHDHEWKDGKRGTEHLPPSSEYQFSATPVVGVALLGVCVIGVAYTVANDVTGVGVSDDFMIVAFLEGIKRGFTMLGG